MNLLCVHVCGFESVHKCSVVDGLNNMINLIDNDHIHESVWLEKLCWDHESETLGP